MFLPIGEWLPDQPDFRNPGSTVVHNVYPRTMQSYGALSSLNAAFAALSARVQGCFTSIDTDGNINVFAGTVSKLYELVSDATSFSDVSGATYATDPLGHWNFALFGNRVLATNFADAIQSFVLGSSITFANLAAAAPKARYMTLVKDFLMVGNTYDSGDGNQPQRVWWPAINDCTNWPTPGTLTAAQVQSDFQDFPGDQGWIQGLVGNLGNADVAVFFERAIWRGTYVGSPSIFSFQAAEGVRGTPAPNSIAHLGAVVFYLGEDGFYMFDGSTSTPIGAQKVDKTFYTDLNPSYYDRICSAIDPINKLVFWAYPSNSSANGICDKLIIYNWSLQRWSNADCMIELLMRSMSFGYTLEGLDATGYNLDTLPFSLDSRAWTGGSVLLSAFDSNHAYGYFTGDTLAATVETSETEPSASTDATKLGARTFIRSVRPISDGGTPSVSISTRNRMIDTHVYGSASAINSVGECPVRADGRYIRAKVTHPAADGFSHISGVELIGNVTGVR